MQLAPFAQGIALPRLFDLDHLCAEFGEKPVLQTVLRSVCHLEHANAAEWTFDVVASSKTIGQISYRRFLFYNRSFLLGFVL